MDPGQALAGALAETAPPAVALARLLLAGWDPRRLAAALKRRAGSAPGARDGGAGAARRAAGLHRLLRAHADGCRRLAAIRVELGRHAPGGAGPRARVAACAALFDACARHSEAASVAAYSLGSSRRLAAATAEVVALLDGWGVLGPRRTALEIGCGAGRFPAALASRVRRVWGLDVAPGLLARARRRCRGLGNVRLRLGSGLGLDGVPARSVDLVYAIDAFPYLHQAGLAGRHVAEAARVLRPGGDLVICNLTYGRALADDRRDLRRWARAAGLVVLVAGVTPFTRWDAPAFHLRRPGR
jgi:SAM-dependent methyltransferase